MPRRRLEPVYDTAVGAGRTMLGFWRTRRHVTGAEHLPDEGGAIIAMTHFSYLEFVLVEWITWLHNRRRIRFMAKKEAFDRWPVGSLLRAMHHIPVDRAAGAGAYADARAALRRGELIGIFPEAGVSQSFTVRELKSGAARLAADAGVPIIPVAVWGGQRLIPKGNRSRFSERFRVPVHLAVGPPIVVPDLSAAPSATLALRETLQQLTDELQRDYPVDGTGQWWQPRHLGGTAPTPEEAAEAEAEHKRERAARRALSRRAGRSRRGRTPRR